MTQLRAKNSKVLAVVHLSSVYILLSHKTITFIHLADSYPKQRTNFIFLPVHIRKLHKFGKVRENSSTSVSHYIEKKNYSWCKSCCYGLHTLVQLDSLSTSSSSTTMNTENEWKKYFQSRVFPVTTQSSTPKLVHDPNIVS